MFQVSNWAQMKAGLKVAALHSFFPSRHLISAKSDLRRVRGCNQHPREAEVLRHEYIISLLHKERVFKVLSSEYLRLKHAE